MVFILILKTCSSVQVKRKEPQELEEGDIKRPHPLMPPDDDDEGLLWSDSLAGSTGFIDLVHLWLYGLFAAADGRIPDSERHGAERENKRRKKKPRSRKPWELDSEGEETSDGSSTEKV